MGRKSPDLLGKRIGRLLVLSKIESIKRDAYWLCRCDCGNETKVTTGHLNLARTRSCGCLRLEGNNSTHRESETDFYKTYARIGTRCNNKKIIEFKNYGGRGIRNEWATYEDFRKDMYESYLIHLNKHGKKDTSIDRIDVNGNYSKENCRWATREMQNNNRRSNRFFTIGGITKSTSQWATYFNLNKGTVLSRVHRGMEVKDIFELNK